MLCVGSASLYAATSGNKKVEITAKDIEVKKDYIYAKGEVLVTYDGSVIKANRASYNKSKKLLILDGNVEMIGYNGTKEHSNHMEIFTQENKVTFDELFLVSENDVWLFSDDVEKNEGNYTVHNSFLSSCDVGDPLWKMFFKRSEYDTEASYMKVYDAKVYLWDVPVFYSPYLAFATNNKRSSGLLFPWFGYSNREGFLYEQPIFWAISPSMDLEVNPQIRTNRSVGVYSTFRFVDSPYSKGEVRLGYFKDKASYVEEENLPDDKHYGFEVNYKSSKLFSDHYASGFKDGIYVNVTYLNDIDYLNLQKNNLTHFGETPLQESRVNYYTYNEDYYVGLNAKYFIDTRVGVNNDETLQIMPSTQGHKFLKHFMIDNFTYSADFKLNNFDRKEGATMRQAEVRIPLEFTMAFMDDFLNLSLGEEFYYSKFFFGNGDFVHDDFQYYSNIHRVKLFSDLTKKYEGFVHVMQPALRYIKPGDERSSPTEFSQLNEEQQALFAIGLPEEEYALSLGQYFYDENMKLKFYQRFSQKYYVNRENELADMTNEMQYNWDTWSFYSNVIYAHEFKKIRESSNRVTLTQKDYYISLGHTYKEVLPDLPSALPGNDVIFAFRYTYNTEVNFNGGFTYNIDEASSRQWYFGGGYHVDCWSVTSSIRQNITPRPTGFTTDNIFNVQFNFIPFATLGTGK
ncbi:MAG: LPS assembly protein LptD [Sulfurovum sp.]|nr:LPS assembly protein LptD [Sulfurovum sp.]